MFHLLADDGELGDGGPHTRLSVSTALAPRRTQRVDLRVREVTLHTLTPSHLTPLRDGGPHARLSVSTALAPRRTQRVDLRVRGVTLHTLTPSHLLHGEVRLPPPSLPLPLPLPSPSHPPPSWRGTTAQR